MSLDKVSHPMEARILKAVGQSGDGVYAWGGKERHGGEGTSRENGMKEMLSLRLLRRATWEKGRRPAVCGGGMCWGEWEGER